MYTTLEGSLVGSIWMPAIEASKPFMVDLDRERHRFTERPSFRELLLHILMEEGGDFQNPSFGIDTTVTVTGCKTVGKKQVRTSKTYELTDFPSVNDLVDETAPIFSGEE